MASKTSARIPRHCFVSCAAGEAIVNPVANTCSRSAERHARPIPGFSRHEKVGLTKIGVIPSNTGFGKGGKENLEKTAPTFGIEILASEVYDKEATDLTGVLTNSRP